MVEATAQEPKPEPTNESGSASITEEEGEKELAVPDVELLQFQK